MWRVCGLVYRVRMSMHFTWSSGGVLCTSWWAALIREHFEIFLWTVVVDTSWEENVCQVLANWNLCSNRINGPRTLVGDEVKPFSVVVAQKVVGGIALVVLRKDLDCLHNLIRGVSYSHFFGVELYGVVECLRIRLESEQKAKILEKFPGLNAVSSSCDVLIAW